MNRRDFLKNTGLFLLGVSGGYAANELFLSSRKPNIKTYKSGETIDNLVCPIEISGWNLDFDLQKLQEYGDMFPKREVIFTLSSHRHEGFSKKIGYGPFKGSSQSGSESIHKNGKEYWRLSSIPLKYSEPSLLYFNEKINEKSISSEIYFILFKFFTHKPSNEFEEIKVYSELPLRENLLKKIHDQSKIFGKFSLTYPLYIVDNDKDGNRYEGRGGEAANDEKRIYLPSKIFTDPIFEEEGLIKLYHESAHVIMEGIMKNDRDPRQSIKMFKSYENLVKAAGFSIPMPTFSLIGPTHEVEKSPYFSIFDESSYLGDIAPFKYIRGYGHPYSNHNELFASGLTILRFFPQEFTRRYQSLNPEQKKVVGNVCKTIFSVITEINNNKDDVNALLPQYHYLSSKL